MDPQKLWAEKYAEKFAALRALELQIRTEAFLDLPREIGGVSVHLMTPRHLHLLEGAGNPLVCGGEPSPADYAQFIWILSLNNSQRNTCADAWRRGRLMRHLSRLSLVALSEQCSAYLEAVFLDSESPSNGNAAPADERPYGGWFLVPLLALLAAEFGSIEPYSGRPWGQVCLPVLFQYRKIAQAKLEGSDYRDRNPSDRLLSDFAAELNETAASDLPTPNSDLR